MAGMTSHKVTVGIYNPETQKTIYLNAESPNPILTESCFDKLCPKYPDNIIRAVYSGVSLRLHGICIFAV